MATPTNPLLDEINGLSPGAKNALMQAHQAAAAPSNPAIQAYRQSQAQPQAPAPSAPLLMPPSKTSTPPMLSASPAPPVSGPYGQKTGTWAPRGTLLGDQQERARQLASGPGESQIYGRLVHSQFGQNHPTAAKILGGVGQGLATAADVAGSMFAPIRTAEMLTPGTMAHHALGLRNLNRQIGQEQQERQSEATTQAEQARTGFENAQAAALPGQEASKQALTYAQIQHLLSPQATNAWEGYAQAQKAQGKEPDVNEFFRMQAEAKVPPQKGVEHVSLKGPTGPIEANFHPDTGKYTDAAGNEIVNPVPYEKPNATIINAGQSEADKIAARLGKPYEAAATAAQAKLDRIDQTARSVDAGYVGQGLAIPELLTSLVSGQGTGVRITQPELNAITAHRGIKGGAESWFNSIAGRGHLTDTDKAQIKGVLNDAKTRMLEKIQLMNDAQDAINGASDRQQVVDADKKYRAIQAGMEKYIEVRRDDQGNWYGSNDGGKTAYDLATGKETQ